MKIALVLAAGLLLLTFGCHRNVQPTIQANLAGKVTEGGLIEAVDVRGPNRNTTEVITRGFHSHAGDRVSLSTIKSDVQYLYSLGFKEVRVEEESGSHGKIVIFHVEEKPIP